MDRTDQIMANAKVLAKLAKFYEKFQKGPVGPTTEFKAQRYMEIRYEQEKLLQ